MRKSFFPFLLILLISTNIDAQSLGGFWKINNNDNKIYNYLKINVLEGNRLEGEYTDNGEIVRLIGSIYEDQTLMLSEIDSDTHRRTYNGAIKDNTVLGFYNDDNGNSNDFNWKKSCNEDGVAIDGSNNNCLERFVTTKVETRMVKKQMQVAEKSYVTTGLTTRDESLPIAETVTEIPANAIIVGEIGVDTIITYKTVEVEVPEEVVIEEGKVVAKQQKSKTSTAVAKKKETVITTVADNSAETVKTSRPVRVSKETPSNIASSQNGTTKTGASSATTSQNTPTAYSLMEKASDEKPLWGTCDIGASNPTAHLAQMEEGATVVENGRTYHIVGKGETMTAICKKYSINLGDLAVRNNKSCERINIGEKLLIK